jgi:hypothetical protein
MGSLLPSLLLQYSTILHIYVKCPHVQHLIFIQMSVQVAGNPGSPLGIKRAKLVVRRVLDIIANIDSVNLLTAKPGLLSLQALRPLHLLPSRTSISCARPARDPGSPNVIRPMTTVAIK